MTAAEPKLVASASIKKKNILIYFIVIYLFTSIGQVGGGVQVKDKEAVSVIKGSNNEYS